MHHASVGAVCRGMYPWELSICGGSNATTAATLDELVTQLRACSNEVARTDEELRLLAVGQQRCLATLAQRHAAIEAAIGSTQQRMQALEEGHPPPSCSSFGAVHSSASAAEVAHEQAYCGGLLLLLRDRLNQAAAQLSVACSSFSELGGTGPPAQPAAGPQAVYETDDEGTVM